MADTIPPDPRPFGGNFDLLRLAAVVTVVYGDGLVLTGAPGAGWWGAPLGRFGLDVLFSISGFLAAGGWEREPRAAPFMARRAARMLPGLAACVLVTAAVIGPLATRLGFAQYAFNPGTVAYLGNAAFIQRLWLPGVFEGQHWSGTVNPMLWTLGAGLAFCLAFPALGLLPARPRPWALGAASVLCAAAALCLPLAEGARLYRPFYVEVLTEAPFFLTGALLRLLQARRPGIWRADLAMLLFAGNWISATWLGPWNIVLEWVSLAYMACCFGCMTAPVLGRVGRLGNPSYGFYLFAFPVQQLIVARWPSCPWPIAACAAISLAAGFASWHLIERPALSLAGRATRLGRRIAAPPLSPAPAP